MTQQPTTKIELCKVGKRFRLEWIFKNTNFTFQNGNAYAVLGPNGSGKSTLLQIIVGSLSPSSGTVQYTYMGKPVDSLSVYPLIAIAAPYLELIEEFTLQEMVHFHAKLKPLTANLNPHAAIDLMELSHAKHKQLRFFSSGMKQRAKLGLALLSDVPVILLDEPATNLDAKALEWYLTMVNTYTEGKLLIVASNQAQEYAFCKQQLLIPDFAAR